MAWKQNRYLRKHAQVSTSDPDLCRTCISGMIKTTFRLTEVFRENSPSDAVCVQIS